MAIPRTSSWLAGLLLSLGLCGAAALADEADLILHNGKIVTVDRGFSDPPGAGRQGRPHPPRRAPTRRSSRPAGRTPPVVDLGGKTVLPGLIDSHTHPTGASMTEFDHPIPEMETIQDVLDYVQVAGQAAGQGQVDRRPPGVHHPAEGAALPDAGGAGPGRSREPGPVRNRPRRLAQLAGAEEQRHRQGFQARGAGQGREGPRTGEPTGILRNLHTVREGGAVGAQAHRAGPGPTPASSCSATTTPVGLTADHRPRAPATRPSTATGGCTRPAP